MSVPGNSALLITLLAVFVACTAYAVGRLHQRYQMERDREEAYRDGYDTATRSVFSLAARVIAPRRAVRGALPAGAVTPEGDSRLSHRSDVPGTDVPGTDVPGRDLPGRDLPGTDVPGSAVKPVLVEVADGSESPAFPAPPPPPPRVVAEPAAVGGVVYRPFPDPRAAGDGKLDPLADVPPGESASSGRHTVPDELVQAATYRLPPDRVFRARVPDATLPEEPTTRLSVPKPRQS